MTSERCNDCEFIPELHYDQEFQVWVRIEDGATLAVGMTDLSQTIAGKILHVRVRRPGTARPKGRPVATIESGKWAGPVPNLFDCVIEQANAEVLDEPGRINADPYAAWIARVRPAQAVSIALSSLLTGEEALRGYCERLRRDDIRCKRLAWS
jgi:glycine cleavage system H protein